MTSSSRLAAVLAVSLLCGCSSSQGSSSPGLTFITGASGMAGGGSGNVPTANGGAVGVGGAVGSGGSVSGGAPGSGGAMATSGGAAGTVGAGGSNAGGDSSNGGAITGGAGGDGGASSGGASPGGAAGSGGAAGNAGRGGAGGVDPSVVEMCKMKLCIDPIFDCIIQGCGFAACEGFVCVIH